MTFFKYKNNLLHCEDVVVDEIVKEVGSPVYIYSQSGLLNSFRNIESAFSSVDTTICFSIKSCSSLGILNVLHQAGSGFDIVSGGELYRALKSGADPRKIVFAGVSKSDQEIKEALQNNILMFNVESEAELININQIANSLNTIASVAIRVNPDVDAHTHAKTTTGKKENKFGIDIPTTEKIFQEISRFPYLSMLGIDMHLGSPINSTSPYSTALEKVVPLILKYRSSSLPLEYINCGGGYGLLYRDQEVPFFTSYAEAIVPYVKQSGCKLILEPGRSISGNNGILVSKVNYIKDNGYKLFSIVDAGMNDLLRPAMYDSYHFIWPTNSDIAPPSRLFSSQNSEEYLQLEDSNSSHVDRHPDSLGLFMTDVVGPVCESSDCFAKNRRLPKLHRGDNLAIFSAGAYGFSMGSHYNSRPRPAEVLVSGNNYHIIRKREDYSSLILGESF